MPSVRIHLGCHVDLHELYSPARAVENDAQAAVCRHVDVTALPTRAHRLQLSNEAFSADPSQAVEDQCFTRQARRGESWEKLGEAYREPMRWPLDMIRGAPA